MESDHEWCVRVCVCACVRWLRPKWHTPGSREACIQGRTFFIRTGGDREMGVGNEIPFLPCVTFDRPIQPSSRAYNLNKGSPRTGGCPCGAWVPPPSRETDGCNRSRLHCNSRRVQRQQRTSVSIDTRPYSRCQKTTHWSGCCAEVGSTDFCFLSLQYQ